MADNPTVGNKRLLDETDQFFSEGPPFKKQKIEHNNETHQESFMGENNGDDALSVLNDNDNASNLPSIAEFIEDLPSVTPKSRVNENNINQSETTPNNLSDQGFTQPNQEVTQVIPQQDPQTQPPQQIPQQDPQQIPQQTQPIPQQVPQPVPQQIPQQIPQQLPQNVPQQASQQISQQVPQQIPQQVPQQIPQQVPQQIPQQVPQQINNQLPMQHTQQVNPQQQVPHQQVTQHTQGQYMQQKPMQAPHYMSHEHPQAYMQQHPRVHQHTSPNLHPQYQHQGNHPAPQQYQQHNAHQNQRPLQNPPQTQMNNQVQNKGNAEVNKEKPKQENENQKSESRKTEEKKVSKEKDEKSNESKEKEEEEEVRTTEQVINQKYLESDNGLKLQEAFRNSSPFRHLVLQDFLTEEMLDLVDERLTAQEWFQKQNDMFTYEKTEDLGTCEDDVLVDFKSALYSEQFREFLYSITGIELYNAPELVGTVYKQGGHFLCHEDDIGHRRLVFFLSFAVEDWVKEDGGTIDLFDTDRNSQPQRVQKSIVPKRNSFVFFELLPNTTYYQISEVLSDKSEFLSIMGWFHGPPLPASQITPERLVPKIPLALLPTGFKVSDWVNPEYLKPEVQKKYKGIFQRENSLSLPNFLLKERADNVEAALRSDDVNWMPIGPPNRRHYDTLGRWGNESETGIILQLKQFLRSKAFVSFVKSLTGLAVHEAFRGEVRRFKSQDYTQVLDSEETNHSEGLDIYIGFQEGEWTDEDGGYTTYQDTEDEILTLVPLRNSLSLVFRESGSMHYVKYLSLTSAAPRYDYQTSFVLASVDDDEGDDYNDEDENFSDDFEPSEDDED